MRAGLVVNPIAGMGGSVGLKGTDDALAARKLGATLVAQKRCEEFLSALATPIEFITCPRDMGEHALKKFHFPYTVIAEEEFSYRDMIPQTTREHTQKFCGMMQDRVDIIVFAGGDGTAFDVFSSVHPKPILGVPCGVKMYSSVFAATPPHAADVLQMFFENRCELRLSEIMDVDEEAFRHNQLKTSLLGYAYVPHVPELVSYSKSVTQISDAEDQDAIAEWVAELIEEGIFVLGPGTTVAKIAETLGADKTLLGVDVYEKKNGKISISRKDACERDLLSFQINQIIISPIGRQGFIFGRGNQQISEAVLSRIPNEKVILVATRSKLRETEYLRIDVSEEINRRFEYVRIVIGYHEWAVRKVVG
jgi:predicted polyphosphate/ATP-dependent NAD kinase